MDIKVNIKSPAELMTDDLARSGLVYSDVLARVMDDSTREATKAKPGTTGYVIPYFDLYGKLTQFYRVKIIGGNISYLQITGSPNHVYFPKGFMTTFGASGYKICLLVEGEKKAALCNKHGIPAIAFGGVDSWINRTLIIPKGAEATNRAGGGLRIKMPSAHEPDEDTSMYAKGFVEFVELCVEKKTMFIIAYDRDTKEGITSSVQKAAAKLGYELRFKGIPITHIRQLVPPHQFCGKDDKTSVENIILHPQGGVSTLLGLIQDCINKRVAFPRHPAIREHLSKQLQKTKMGRKETQNVSLALLTDLDIRGQRMYSPDDFQYFYFNNRDRHLMKTSINRGNLAPIQETEFGMLLYKEYGISLSADNKLVQWLGSQYAAEEPLDIVYPYRIIGKPQKGEDVIRVQINNGQYIKVTGNPNLPYEILPNGSENTLFESQNPHIEGIDADLLLAELKKREEETNNRETNPTGRPRFWWSEVISEVRLRNPGKQSLLVALLYYMSPYLMRWRGTQLPVEIVVGEAGSGKSTLCEIRLNILTGDPQLRNSPKDQKDFYAQLANCGGLTVTDNIVLMDKNLRQSMSDELCRLVTEYDPRINMRKYYTEADERSIRVNSVFAYTSVKMPFQNSDLLQRSVILELTKIPENVIKEDGTQDLTKFVSTTFDSNWKDKKLAEYGGRTAWMSHQVHILHLFLKSVAINWDPNYKAKHRLVNFEQSLRLLADIFGGEGAGDWIPDYLSNTTDKFIAEADWTMEGLQEFALYARKNYVDEASKITNRFKTVPVRTFTTSDIAIWADTVEDYEENHTLKQSRLLSKYMMANKYNIAKICGIIEQEEKKGNRIAYRVNPTPDDLDKIKLALKDRDKK